ncbi:MAG: hypothetical protein KDC85_24320 [Saprospiraceae bacterium]|nr:hypothetical protein [Saprospiraceae bacterium]MCB9326622.1 hypothetical protein [Lewinellaceae bacterium]
MAQFRWSYLSPQGKRHIVGIFHGERTGHLMIYVNSKVVQIDFKVFEDKLYSFFIDEELCEVSVEKKGERFSYEFKLNKDADTPLNRRRKAFNRVNRNRIIALFVGLALFITLGLVFGSYQKRKREKEKQERLETLMARKTARATATIDSIKWSGDQGIFFYTFPEGDALSNGQTHFERSGVAYYSEGLPIEKGDEFLVEYNSSGNSSKLLLNEPTSLQWSNYLRRAYIVEEKFNPHLSGREILCRVECAYRVGGLPGLADVYFQDRSPEANPRHNELTYKRLVRDIPFQTAYKQYCLPGLE